MERFRRGACGHRITRIDSPGELDDDISMTGGFRAPISRQAPTWVPTTDIRGEGLFIQFREETLQRWLAQDEAKQLNDKFYESHCRWQGRVISNRLARATPACATCCFIPSPMH